MRVTVALLISFAGFLTECITIIIIGNRPIHRRRLAEEGVQAVVTAIVTGITSRTLTMIDIGTVVVRLIVTRIMVTGENKKKKKGNIWIL